MIKHIKFIKQLFTIIKKNNLSYEEVLSMASVVDNNKKPLPALSSEEVERLNKQIKKKLIDIFAKKFVEYRFYHKEFWALKSEAHKEGLYNSDKYLSKIILFLNQWVQGTYVSGDFVGLSTDLKIPIDIDGDTIFDSVSLSQIAIKGLYFTKDFLYLNKQEAIFKKSEDWRLTQELYKKDFSLLMLASFYGCDDFIETLIKNGCDINYKEPLTNKTAFDYYTGNAESPSDRVDYIKTLLNGTYKDGHYQKLYEEKKSKAEKKLDSVAYAPIQRAYGLYSQELQEIYQKIEYLKSLELPVELMTLRDTVFTDSFTQLVQKSVDEEKIKAHNGILDPHLKETIDYLSQSISKTIESLGEKGLNTSHKETKILKQYLMKSGL